MSAAPSAPGPSAASIAQQEEAPAAGLAKQEAPHGNTLDEAMRGMEAVLNKVAKFIKEMHERNAGLSVDEQALNLAASSPSMLTFMADQSRAATRLVNAARAHQALALAKEQEQIEGMQHMEQLQHRAHQDLEQERAAHAAERAALLRDGQQQLAMLKQLQDINKSLAGKADKAAAVTPELPAPGSGRQAGSTRRSVRTATREPGTGAAPQHGASLQQFPVTAAAGPDNGEAPTAAAATALTSLDAGVPHADIQSPGKAASVPPAPLPVIRPKSEPGLGWVIPAGVGGVVPAVATMVEERAGAGGSEEGDDVDRMDEDDEKRDGNDMAGAGPSSARQQGPPKFHIQSISWEQVQALFHLQRDEAAQKLGIASSTLKRICREHGIERWPFRKLQSIEVMLKEVEARAVDDPRSAEELLVELKSYKAAVYADPDVKFDDRILQERTRLFKKRYAERQAAGATGRVAKRPKSTPGGGAGEEAGGEEEWGKWEGEPGSWPTSAAAQAVGLAGHGPAGLEALVRDAAAAAAAAGVTWSSGLGGLAAGPSSVGAGLGAAAASADADASASAVASASAAAPAVMTEVTEAELIAHEVLSSLGMQEAPPPASALPPHMQPLPPMPLLVVGVNGALRPASPFMHDQVNRPPRSPRGLPGGRVPRSRSTSMALPDSILGQELLASGPPASLMPTVQEQAAAEDAGEQAAAEGLLAAAGHGSMQVDLGGVSAAGPSSQPAEGTPAAAGEALQAAAAAAQARASQPMLDLSAAHSLTELAALAQGPPLPLPHTVGHGLGTPAAGEGLAMAMLPDHLQFVMGPGGPLGPGGILGPAGLSGPPLGPDEEGGAAGSARRTGRRGSHARGSVSEELERLKRVFHLPVGQAAQELGMGLTAFKKYCRQRFNISRWPYRKVQSIESVLSAQLAAGAPQDILEMLKRQMQAVYDNPEEELCDEFMRMRRQHHKAQWRQRRDGGDGPGGFEMFDDKDGSGNEDSD